MTSTKYYFTQKENYSKNNPKITGRNTEQAIFQKTTLRNLKETGPVKIPSWRTRSPQRLIGLIGC